MHPVTCAVDSYRDAVLALVAPLAAESVPLLEALGRVTAAPLSARLGVPGFDNSAMDGYAVRAIDVASAHPGRPARLTLLPAARAGSRQVPALAPGYALPIMTGAPIPAGCDLVVPVENSRAGRFGSSAVVELWPGGKTHIRRAGEDIAAGSAILLTATALTPRDLALLAATGHERVSVHRRPRVAIIATGDELARGASGDATVPDSNSVYLRAAVQALGGEPAPVRTAADDDESLARALDAAARDADLIVSTGGVGAGTHDIAGRLAASTPEGMLARVAMRPGRPQAHGRWAGTPWLALPGNPTAAFVSFEAFVRPVLDRLAGRPACTGTTAETVSVGWAGAAGTVRYVPLAVDARRDAVSVMPLGDPAHAGHSLAAMFRASLIGVVGAQTSGVEAGQLLPVIEPA